jgi:adenine-specific DNA glycosylase
MHEITVINHKIQKYILSILIQQSSARFRDMRPPRTDTNLYSYHLTKLIKNGFVKKVDGNYTLDIAGLAYASQQTGSFEQSDNEILFVIQNSDGDILLQRRTIQPYIDSWALPSGGIYSVDLSLTKAAQQEASDLLGLAHQPMTHSGDCYIRVSHDDFVVAMTLAHVFTFNRDNIATNDNLQWMRPHKLSQYSLAPGTEQIVSRTFFRDPFFFEEFEENW